MAFAVALRNKADRAIGRLGESLRDRIYAGLQALKENPLHARPGADIKMLRGDRGQYRLRIGEYRVFYVVDDKTVYVTDVLHRSHAYD